MATMKIREENGLSNTKRITGFSNLLLSFPAFSNCVDHQAYQQTEHWVKLSIFPLPFSLNKHPAAGGLRWETSRLGHFPAKCYYLFI